MIFSYVQNKAKTSNLLRTRLLETQLTCSRKDFINLGFASLRLLLGEKDSYFRHIIFSSQELATNVYTLKKYFTKPKKALQVDTR